MVNNSDKLRESSHFDNAINNKFAKLLIENKCPDNLLDEYFKQDYYFVLEDIEVLKKLIDLSKDNIKNKFKDFMDFALTDEIPVFKDFFNNKKIIISDIIISKTTLEYINFMKGFINTNNFIWILSMLLAGEWVYLETFASKNTDNFYINQWEKLHSDVLRNFINFMIKIINNNKIDAESIKIFDNTVEMEIKFFNQFI